MKNARIKRARNSVKELKRLKQTVFGKDAADLMEICSEVVDPKTIEELKEVIADEYVDLSYSLSCCLLQVNFPCS